MPWWRAPAVIEPRTAEDVEAINRTHENKIKSAFVWTYGLCLCAIVALLFSIFGWFRPQVGTPGQWIARSGALMTIFAGAAQIKAANIATMIAGGTFGETWGFYRRYQDQQKAVARLSLALTIIGTFVWGYGDLLFP
jgi:hypothetical protein